MKPGLPRQHNILCMKVNNLTHPVNKIRFERLHYSDQCPLDGNTVMNGYKEIEGRVRGPNLTISFVSL